MFTPAVAGSPLNAPNTLSVTLDYRDNLAVSSQFFINEDAGGETRFATLENTPAGLRQVSVPVSSYAVNDRTTPGSVQLQDGDYTVRLLASTAPNGGGIFTEVSGVYNVTGLSSIPLFEVLANDGDATDTLTRGSVIATSLADGGAGTGNPADFGADGTITELRARVENNTLFVVIRGDMFGDTEANLANGTYLFIDIDGGLGTGVTDTTVLNDVSDGLRSDISSTNFLLSTALVNQGFGFDAVVGVTAPNIGFGYSFGSAGLQGSNNNFQFIPGISVTYDDGVVAIPPAAGLIVAMPDAIEIAIPLDSLNQPNLNLIRLAAVTSSDLGYASPNTLPENTSNAFAANATNTQTLEALAQLPAAALGVVINEVFLGDDDWIEFFNSTANPIDLSGWALLLYDSDEMVIEYRFPQGTSIASNQYLVLSDEGKSTPPASSVLGNLFTGFNIPWDEERGGAVALIGPAGQGVDYVSWLDVNGDETNSAGEIPYGASYTGTPLSASASRALNHSIGRNSTSLDTNNSSDWENTSGVDASAPTPRAANFGTAPSTVNLWMLY
jgi:hypothetical protein